MDSSALRHTKFIMERTVSRSFTATIYVSNRVRRILQIAISSNCTDSTTADGYSDMTVRSIRILLISSIYHHVFPFWNLLAISIRICISSQISAQRSQTATTIDRAQDRTILDVKGNISTHNTSCQCRYRTSSSTKHISFVACGAERTNHRGRSTDRRLRITQHVTVLTATEDRTIDRTTRDSDLRTTYISPSVEQHALVALASSEEVTNDGVSQFFIMSARHTDRTARHRDSTLTFARFQLQAITDVCLFITSIHIRQDMSVGNFHFRITFNNSSTTNPFAWRVWLIPRAAAKHITIEGMTVGSRYATSISIIAFCSRKLIVWSILTFIRPGRTFFHRSRIPITISRI